MARDIDLYRQNVGRGSRIPTISLGSGAGVFKPADFDPTVFVPQQEDMSLLQKSMQTLDERKERTDKQRAAIQSALAEVKLNAKEDAWKKNYIDNISKQIDSAAQFGDYSTALSVATTLAGTAMSDPALRGRMRANEQYEEEIKRQKARVDRGDISQNTYAWWLKNNPYSYSDITDENGDIVGGTEYEPTFRPANDINWASAAMAAFKMITPYKSSVSTDGSTSVTNHTTGDLTRGGKTYKSGESISSSGHSSFTEEKVTKEQIIARMEELLSSTPDGYRQAEQAYDVARFEFDNMLEEYGELVKQDPNSKKAKDLYQKLEARKHLMYNNASPIDYKEYYARMITNSLYADGLAYDWKTSSSGGSSSYSISDIGGSGGLGGSGRGSSGFVTSSTPISNNSVYDYDARQWKTPLVRQRTNIESVEQGVSGAVEGIDSRF